MRKEAVELALYQMECTLGLIRQCKKDWWDERDIPVLETAIEALLNQIPMKPLKMTDFENKNFYRLYCPICGANIGHGDKRAEYVVKTYASQKCCGECGQVIDWTEDVTETENET